MHRDVLTAHCERFLRRNRLETTQKVKIIILKASFFFHRKNEIVICIPTEHLGVLMKSFKRVCAFQIDLEFGMLVFKERGKQEYPEKNPS